MEQIEDIENDALKPWDLDEIKDKSFNEVLAKAVAEDKMGMVKTTLAQFQKGEAGAIKMVTQALSEHKRNEENSFPIDDERFKQIIELAAEASRAGEI